MADFSEDTFQNEVREILKDYSKTYQAAGEKVIAAVLEKVHDGEPVSQAVKEALAETDFQAAIEKAVTDAVLLAACAGYGVKPELLTTVSRETLTRHLLDDAWAEDNVKLSRRLHTMDVEKRVVETIQTALRNAQTIRDTAMELYDGYNTGEGELDRSHLTKQLGKITSLASLALSGDEEAARDVRKAARKVKQYALNLQTPNLRTAYAELADVCGDNLTEKALDRAVRAAIEERTRYHAERIARTEAARAWYDGHIARTQDDEDVWGYRWVLSSRHALVPFDQCDVCANADVGYGKGIYPKNRVPSIPRHPHCMCSLVDVIVGETKGQSREMNEDGARSYIDGLSDQQKMQLFGIEGRKAYEDGGDWQNLLRGWDGFSEPKSRLKKLYFDMNIDVTDVRPEYVKTASPKIGEVVYDTNYDMAAHREEVQIANVIHDTFGGDIKLLNEVNGGGKRMPDYLWNGKMWELKTLSTEKAVDSALRKGLKQIIENPGGIILNYVGDSLSKSLLEQYIITRMKRSGKGTTDLILFQNSSLLFMRRYKKKD